LLKWNNIRINLLTCWWMDQNLQQIILGINMSLLSLKYTRIHKTTHVFHQWISYFKTFSNKYLKTLMQRIQRRRVKRRQWNYRLLWIPDIKLYVSGAVKKICGGTVVSSMYSTSRNKHSVSYILEYSPVFLAVSSRIPYFVHALSLPVTDWPDS
jgi:hypothetical protein